MQHACVYAVQQSWLQALLTPLENYSAMVVQQHSINVGARHVQQTAQLAVIQHTHAVHWDMAASA